MSGVELADEISALTRRDTRELSSPLCSLPHEDTARRQPSANQEEGFQELNLPAPILDFLDSQSVRNKFLLFKPPRVWYLVIASCTKRVVFSLSGQEE